MNISVVTCTHNPRPDYLRRLLDALQAQTLPKEQWEFLLIDNASQEPLAGKWGSGWHPHARVIREEELGLTAARLRGIRESTGELLVFVDDDNVLDKNYIQNAIAIAAGYPFIGAFGASIKAEFEEPPAPWIAPYLPSLAISEIDRDYWSNLYLWSQAFPCGAGMCVRRAVAEDYVRKISTNPFRKTLDRTGTALTSGGDDDLALCAVDLGMGTGRFRSLSLTHLIPKNRLTLDYITRLQAGQAFSYLLLQSFRTTTIPREIPEWRVLLRLGLSIAQAPRWKWGILIAVHKAKREARLRIASQRAKCNR